MANWLKSTELFTGANKPAVLNMDSMAGVVIIDQGTATSTVECYSLFSQKFGRFQVITKDFYTAIGLKP